MKNIEQSFEEWFNRKIIFQNVTNVPGQGIR